MGLHSLWTFTKRGKFSSSQEVWAAWRLFSQQMRRRYGDRWKYVAVPELHADGETWHLHVAFSSFYWVGTLRRFWYRALGGSGVEVGDETPGSVNAKRIGRGHSNARRCSSYLAKYVGKGFERSGANKRVFAASACLGPVSDERWHGIYDDGPADVAAAVGRWLYEAYGYARSEAHFYREPFLEGFVVDTR